MKLNAPTLLKIEDIQKKSISKNFELEYAFKENRFLLFSFAVFNGVFSTLKVLMENLKINKKEAYIYLDTLLKEDLINEKTYTSIANSLETTINNTKKQKNYSEEIEEILNNFNKITGKRVKGSKNVKAYIIKHLKNGFKPKDFKQVNIYYSKLWDNPTMKKYIKPSTLYNNKFPDRVEQAKEYFNEIEKYKEDIKKICLKFKKLIFLEFKTESKFYTPNQEDICENIPFSLKEKIAFWRNKYSTEEIINVIELTISSWSKKPSLAKHISLSKILDNKFEERLIVVKRILEKNNQFKNKAIQDVNEWLEEQLKQND